MMITSALLLLSVGFEPARNPVMQQCIHEGFTYFEYKTRKHVENSNLKASTGVVFNMSTGPAPSSDADLSRSFDGFLATCARRGELEGTPLPDLMPFGRAFLCGVRSSGGVFIFVGQALSGRADLHPTYERKGKGSKLNPIPDKLVERFVPMVRWQLAILEGDELDKDARWGGRSWVSLRSTANASRFEMLENVQAARYAVNTPKGQAILPLASFQAKIGSNWVDAGGMILIRNNEPYIPQKLANLLKATGN